MAYTLFGVVTCHRLIIGRHNRGVLLITGAVTLVTWPDTLVTRSYMHKNGGEAPGQDTVGASRRQGG